MASRRSVTRTILIAWLVAGTLDLADAIVFYGIYSKVPATRILQSIAAGVLGKASFTGGNRTAALGLCLHYAIALFWTALFVLTAQRIAWMSREALRAGVAYGLFVYAVMNYVVLPLSHAGHPSHLLIPLVNAVLAIVLFIGLPISLLNRRFA